MAVHQFRIEVFMQSKQMSFRVCLQKTTLGFYKVRDVMKNDLKILQIDFLNLETFTENWSQFKRLITDRCMMSE